MSERAWLNAMARAALEVDWDQVRGYRGVPCFYVEADGRFCGRSHEWPGHDGVEHEHTTLHAALLYAGGDDE